MWQYTQHEFIKFQQNDKFTGASAETIIHMHTYTEFVYVYAMEWEKNGDGTSRHIVDAMLVKPGKDFNKLQEAYIAILNMLLCTFYNI